MFATRSHLPAAASCLVALSAYASVAAPILPVSQARSVTAAASHPLGTPSSDSESAPDFGPFDGRASAASGPSGDLVTADVTQASTIAADRIDLQVDGIALLSVFGGDATASSSFDVTFDLLVESDYSLFYEGLLNQFVSTGGTLSNDQGVIVNLFPQTAQTGVLSPGRYRLEAFATGLAATSELEGRIDQRLTLEFTPIPEPSTAWLVASGFVLLAAIRGAGRRSVRGRSG